MLTERYDLDSLRAHLLPTAEWQPFPRARQREAWEGLLHSPLNKQRYAYVVGQAEALLEQAQSGGLWPSLPATLYMEFARNGNRNRFEEPYFQRRQNLATLVLAECLEYQGRFLDETANGIWAITEEATWCISAHAERTAGDVLPRQDRQSVDLFACETAMVLAEAYYLLADELMALSPALCARLLGEIERRIIEPVEQRDDFFWLAGRNNWSPWCASNVTGAAMLVLEDMERLARLTHKMMAVVDRFISQYGPDGGCDEGPGYWGVAAGAMLLFLETLYSRSNGRLSVYDDPLIANMGRFIVNVHLAGPWFVNFADAAARIDPRRAVVYRYGERVGDQSMCDLALLSARNWDAEGEVSLLFNSHHTGADLGQRLRDLWWVPADAQPQPLQQDTSAWLPDLQVLVARESQIPEQGLILAAKGGHNAENHNHNDIGQFIVFLDGQPGIIDIGVETYSRKTFSPQRYDIWCIRSAGHNVPLVNGVEQAAGREYAAGEVRFQRDGNVQRLAMQLAGAYPPEAGLTDLRRVFTFDGDASAISVEDTFQRVDGPTEIVVPLYAVYEVEQLGPGLLAIGCSPRRLLVRYDPATVQVTIETVELTDNRLRGSWGDRLQRITCTYRQEGKQGSYRLVFEPEA